MTNWRSDLERVAEYHPEGGSIWQTIELCLDVKNNVYCLVTERMAREGIIKFVSLEFAESFIKEFGKKGNCYEA